MTTPHASTSKWVNEDRNIYEDFRKFFGEEPPLLGAVALMTDTDNTGEEAVAWYGDITLVSHEAVTLPAVHRTLNATIPGTDRATFEKTRRHGEGRMSRLGLNWNEFLRIFRICAQK
jgi:hypothetical protein